MTPRDRADEIVTYIVTYWQGHSVTLRDRIEAAIIAATEDAEAHAKDKRNWQPINTVPKDGTVILLYVPGFDSYRHCREAGPDITFGYYSTEKSWSHLDGWLSLETKDEPDYEGGTYHTKIYLDDSPTHWMPVPDAPNTDPKSRSAAPSE